MDRWRDISALLLLTLMMSSGLTASVALSADLVARQDEVTSLIAEELARAREMDREETP